MHEQRSCRLLVIDDDSVDCELIQMSLEESGLGFELQVAVDAASGRRHMESTDWDCVIMDLRLPEGDSLDLFARFFEQSCAQRPPVVLLTGMGGERVAVDALKRGADDYLPKAEITPDALRRAVEGAMEKAALQRVLHAKEQELLYLSLHDGLTGLPNRTLFLDRMDQHLRAADREKRRFTVMMMDLNLFKGINDSLGHEAGDHVLRCVAERLARAVRGSDTVARLGGDEFAALLATARDEEGAVVVAEKLARVVAEPMQWNGHELRVGLSIGMAIWPEHGGDRDALLRNADAAMYEAKHGNRGHAMHAEASTARTSGAAATGVEVGPATAEQELRLEYAPQVDLASGGVRGVQVLVRWHHPVLGLLPPMAAVPAPERGAVLRLRSLRVLDLALAQAAAWRRGGIDLPLAVSLSPRLFEAPASARDVAGLLDRHGVDPRRLTLEFSETDILGAATGLAGSLRRLAESGVQIAIDDFGTGLASLDTLRGLPVNELKIDRRFVEAMSRGSQDESVVRSILGVAGEHELRVVAEGVDGDQSWRRLAELGCPFGQGARFGGPLAADACAAWSRQWQAGLATRVVSATSGTS